MLMSRQVFLCVNSKKGEKVKSAFLSFSLQSSSTSAVASGLTLWLQGRHEIVIIILLNCMLMLHFAYNEPSQDTRFSSGCLGGGLWIPRSVNGCVPSTSSSSSSSTGTCGKHMLWSTQNSEVVMNLYFKQSRQFFFYSTRQCTPPPPQAGGDVLRWCYCK